MGTLSSGRSFGGDANAGKLLRCLSGEPREDKRLCSRFKDLKLLGEGAQGVVVRATPLEEGAKPVALKLIRREKLRGEGEEQQAAWKHIIREIYNHSRLCHPLLIEFQGAFVSDFYLVIVMECATVPVRFGRELPSLELFLGYSKKGLSEDIARFYFQQLVVAVDYCHQRKVSNRDLKLDHCLLHDKEGVNQSSLPLLKLCDWGLSKSGRVGDSAADSFIGTPGYYAPEVVVDGFNNRPYNPYLADIYACGVILWKLLCGRDSWPDRDPEDERRLSPQEFYNYYCQKQKDGIYLKFAPNKKISYACKDLLVKILQPNWRDRCTFEQVLEHEWFTTDFTDDSRQLNPKLLDPMYLDSIEARAPKDSQVKDLLKRAASRDQ